MSEQSFDYRNKAAVKLSQEFKNKFIVNIKGKEAIKLEGLTAFAHTKGLWKLETDIIQYPTQENGFTCICKTTVGGYDYDPVTDKVREVVYSDIGDANANNCTKMVAAAFIRMASTRSQARALRKYVNIDMVCSSELDNVTEEPTPTPISMNQLSEIKTLIKQKGFSQEVFVNMLTKMFGHPNYMNLTEEQGNTLIAAMREYIKPDNNN